ncbi:MAG: hypothetical protein J0H98_09015 [Solirubrobacterales bacterium]|nr:hypothetical protein [Solirubrobacterales bacterium]
MFAGRRKKVSVLAGFVVLAVSACAVPAASGNGYDVWSCRGPLGQPLSADAWNPRATGAQFGDVTLTDTCSTGGPVELRMTDFGTGPRSPRLDLEFDLPRGEKIIEYSLNRAMVAAGAFGPPYVYASAVRETAGGTTDFGCASYLALPDFDCSFEGSTSDPTDPTNQRFRTGLSLDGLSVWIACTSSGCNPPFAPPSAQFVLWSSAVTIEDNDPPDLVDIGGVLAGPGPVNGRVNLYVEADDDNAGVSAMDLSVDGTPYQHVNVSTPTCSLPYQMPNPCPGNAGRIFTVDTTTLAEGGHIASGTITDAAGNQTPFGPISFFVEHVEPGPPPPDNGKPAVLEPDLKLDTTSITHRPGATPVVAGRLETDDGYPIEGASLGVQVTSFTTSGDRTETLAPALTGRDGRFQVSLPGQGSRTIEFSFSPSEGQAITAKQSAHVKSTLKVTLNTRPRRVRIGRKVTFRGRLSGAGPAAKGVPVEIQAKVSGRWDTVATVATRANGVYVWRYRFRYVERNALFSFRAQVRGTPGWPWPSTNSPVRKVGVKVKRR